MHDIIMADPRYEYIIVGGGTAGLVLASRLSENGNVRVLVLEAGEDQTTDPRVLTPVLWTSLLNTSTDWAFQTTPQAGLQGRSIACPQGRLLGGSSGLNGHAFTATSKSNIDAWEKLGNEDWNWSTLSPYLKKTYTLGQSLDKVTAELAAYINPKVHGVDGPLQLSLPEMSENDWPKVWVDTLRTLGLPVTGDPFSGESFGAYINAESIDPVKRQRSFAANAYLEPVKDRDNITVVIGASVNKILFDKSSHDAVRATGVEYAKDGRSITATITTPGEVIICAGTFNSPRLLELSGICDPQQLKKYGIDVVIDNPGVGENLQNHVLCGTSFEVNEGLRTMDPIARQDQSALGAAMEAYGKNQSGPFATGGTFASAQLPLPNTNTAEEKLDLDEMMKKAFTDLHLGPSKFPSAHADYVRSILSSPTEASGCHITFPGHATVNPDGTMAPPPAGTENYFTIITILCHPLSRGSVHLTSGVPDAKLEINPNYLSNPLDIDVLARHLLYVEKNITQTSPLKDLIKPGGKRSAGAPAHIHDIDTAKEYIRQTAVGAHHFTGTCSMMPRDMGGVVDAKLRVYGCENLRVCDASIIPLTPRTNPQATVYAVAERAADLMKQG